VSPSDPALGSDKSFSQNNFPRFAGPMHYLDEMSGLGPESRREVEDEARVALQLLLELRMFVRGSYRLSACRFAPDSSASL
jgi:hypothetical protein